VFAQRFLQPKLSRTALWWCFTSSAGQHGLQECTQLRQCSQRRRREVPHGLTRNRKTSLSISQYHHHHHHHHHQMWVSVSSRAGFMHQLVYFCFRMWSGLSDLSLPLRTPIPYIYSRILIWHNELRLNKLNGPLKTH